MGLAINKEGSMVRMNHAVDCESVFTLVPSWPAICTKPADNMGPNTPITAENRAAMS